MAEQDFKNASMLVTVGLTLAMESMNLKRPMNEIQILDLAEAIIDTAAEDNLAMEDLMLFLQKLTRGEYGAMYESIDIPKFMEKFEIYRQERHEALQNHRYEIEVRYKTMGDTIRQSTRNELDEHFASMADRMSDILRTNGCYVC
jgi:hypothetical protein